MWHQALADMAGVHLSQMKRYEGGTSQPALDVLRNIAIALSVSADVLLFDSNERGPDEDFRLRFEALNRLDQDERAVVKELIVFLRNQRVLLDADLAALYDVTTKRFNEQVKRNLDRFPKDFMFQLTDQEFAALRSQFATSNAGRGGRRYLPYAFTEHGAIMAPLF